MKIENYDVDVDPTDLLIALRQDLANIGVHRLREIRHTGGKNIAFTCPFHKGGQEHKASCGLVLYDTTTIKAGTVHCFTCGYTKSLFEMISELFGKQDFGDYGKTWICKTFDITFEKPLFSFKTVTPTKVQINQQMARMLGKYGMSDEELQKYRYIHPYMYERGLTGDVIERYDIGYDANFVDSKGNKIECITFPIYDNRGKVEHIIRRAIHKKQFFIPSGYQKGLYGEFQFERDKHLFPGARHIYVTESIINCLTLVKWGYPAIALNGTGSYEQMKKIGKHYLRPRLVFDGDPPGRRAMEKWAIYLKKHSHCISVEIIYVPLNKDINNLKKAEFEKLEVYG